MKSLTIILLALSALAGCDTAADPVPGKVQFLGDTADYETAFIAAKGIMAKRYNVEYADPVTGIIRCEPKLAYGNSGLLLGGKGQTRELATLKLRRSGSRLAAVVTVEVQAQGEESEKAFSSVGESYSGAPNATPAQGTGATTPQQNSSWRTVRYAKDIEGQILHELYQSISGVSPETSSQPTTEPAE